MTKYKKKQVGHLVNMAFSLVTILFCVFVAKVTALADFEKNSLFIIFLASGLIALMVGNISFSIKKLRYLATIKHKFVTEE